MSLLTVDSPIAPLALLFAAGWLLWKLFHGYVVKSPLDRVPGPAPTSFWTGHLNVLFDRHGWEFHKRLAEHYDSSVVKVRGLFGSKGLYVFDPKALNSILLKDQASYEIPESLLMANHMTFGPNLLSVTGDIHRKQRKLLTPVFHINHMRTMTPLFYHTVHRLHDAVAAQVGKSAVDVNVLDWMGRTALELIGQGGLGYSFDPLTENKSNAYGQALKDLVPVQITFLAWMQVIPYIVSYIPLSIRTVLARYVPLKRWGQMMRIVDALDSQAKDIFHGKRTALEKGDEAVVHQIGEGKDIMSILMKANMQASVEDRLTDEELLGQMSLLVFAATDTTSNSLARTLQMLAQDKDRQDKLRAEIVEASPDGEDIPYDTLVSLPYLDAVCRETLRVHPAVTKIFREAREDAVLPLSEPIMGTDGQMLSEILVPKGTDIYIAIEACNTNKALWGDDALEWKPERWLAPLPEALGKAHIPGVYSNLMTFNGGGRACLGFKFSQLEMKVVLAVMLRSFKVSLSDKEIYWNMAGVNYPTVGKVDNTPAQYLRLERIDA